MSCPNPSQRPILALVALFALGLLVPMHLPATSRPETQGADVPWRKLAFKATKLLMTAHADIELAWIDATDLDDELLTGVPGAPLVPRGRLGELELSSRFAGRHSTTTLWFDPDDLAAYQRSSRDYGRRNRLKVVRFGEEGVFARRLRPANDQESQLEPPSWSDRADEIHAFEPGTLAISDPSTLFYLLAAADPEQFAKGGTLRAFSRGTVGKIEIELLGYEPVRASYTLHSADGENGAGNPSPTHIDCDVEAIRYALRPDSDSDELQLLGLEGDVEIWIETERRLPIQVSGRVSPLGRVTVRLREAWLK